MSGGYKAEDVFEGWIGTVVVWGCSVVKDEDLGIL